MLTPRHLLRCVHNVTGRRRLALAARARLHVAGVILEGIGAAVAVAAFTANSEAERGGGHRVARHCLSYLFFVVGAFLYSFWWH